MKQHAPFIVEKQNTNGTTRKASKSQGRRIIPSPLGNPFCLNEDKSFPKICIWESDYESGDITCDIIDAFDVLRDDVLINKSSPFCFMSKEVKKQGVIISKGHKSYELMLCLQLGIRHSIGKMESTQLRELRNDDFDPREKYWTKFPSAGSKTTPPHQLVEFRWKDYCPAVFRHLRKLFGVSASDYIMALCGNEALRELSSPGKSGSFFYLTQNDRFIIKTVKKSEVKVLIRMLQGYYRHVSQNKNSLITKFFGVHCVKPIGGQKVRFIVMNNVFCSEHQIHRRFDLKGSSHGRTTYKAEKEIDENTTFKDLDLNFVFHVQPSWFRELVRQTDRDCKFLEAEGIMDYSLLVGLHFCDNPSISKMDTSSPIRSNNKICCPYVMRNPLIRLGAHMPARAKYMCRNSNLETYHQSYNVVLYFGIIDILQGYDISKKLEHVYKSWQADPCSISAVDPKSYSSRFREFIYKVFINDND